jgi:ribonuclease Z
VSCVLAPDLRELRDVIEITLLGTGSPLVDPTRGGPATLVRAGGATLLFDCGRGVLMRAAAAGAQANGLTALVLTHLHSDHITDLNDVITSRWVTTFEPSPLRVLGPPGTSTVVDGILASLAPDISYRLAHHDDLTWEPPVAVAEALDGVVFDEGGVRIEAAPTDHRPVEPSVGYRVEHGGQAVVIAGDTVPCTGLDRLCDGADALVHTVIRADQVQAIPVPRLQDILDYHSSVEQAAQTAARGGVGTLVLTHYVPPMQPGAEEEWRSIAAAHFPGRIELGDDLHRVVVGEPS